MVVLIMAYQSLEIEGLRGFGPSQKLELAVPNGTDHGTGLTIVVGENNSGKSTIIEALRSFTTASPNFSEGQRNKATGEKVRIVLRTNEAELVIATIPAGGSESKFDAPLSITKPLRLLALPSRRHFDVYFNSESQPRDAYERQILQQYRRSGPLNAITGRLVAIAAEHREEFNKVLAQLIDPVPDWIIEKADHGPKYIKIRRPNGHSHSSEGAGEGLLSLICIADALYDSNPGDLIVIDEPELSLHPAVLRRLSRALGEYSKDRQIVIATHSPYFADPSFLCNGATLCRVFICEGGSTIAQTKQETLELLRGFITNKNNPHVLGLDAREIFFQKDGIILVEGQEDVVFYPEVEKELGLRFEGTFFGWGVGGAGNMHVFASLLQDLGFAKVVGILDRDQEQIALQLQQSFLKYLFLTIPADDVRTKAAREATPEKIGLLNGLKLRDEFNAGTRAVIEQINEYLLG